MDLATRRKDGRLSASPGSVVDGVGEEICVDLLPELEGQPE